MVQHYRFFAELLDTLGIAACLYDEQHQARVWNQSFFTFFPEHEGAIFNGEPYSENLRRFYLARLDAEDLLDIDRYIRDGVARHASQTRPFSFEHRGVWIRVSCTPIPGVGRFRIWQRITPPVERTLHDQLVGLAEQGAFQSSDFVIENIADGLAVTDQYDRIVSVNQNFLNLYRVASKEQVIGLSLSALYKYLWTRHEGETVDEVWLEARISKLMEDLLFSGAPFELPIPANRWVRMITQRDAAGMVFSIHTDITELKRKQEELAHAEQKARESERQYKLLAHHASDVIVGLDREQRVRYASPSIQQLLGVSPERLLNQQWFSIIASDGGTRFDGAMPRDKGEIGYYTFRARNDNGQAVWIEKSVSVLPAQEDPQEIEIIFHLRDVSSRKAIEEKLEQANQELAVQARTDALTLLSNRRHFNDTIGVEWRRMRRNRDSLALLLIDIDHFKMVNDQFGHPVGDLCLQHVAALIQQLARRPADLAARFGGEEFALLLPQMTGPEAAIIAEAIRDRISETPFDPLSSSPIRLTVSIGIASIAPGSDADDAETLVREADVALYRAKRNGRNRCELAA